MVQKELPVSRDTISQIERGTLNVTLGTILEVLASVNGNISDAFAIRVPRRWRGEHEFLHEQLQAILTDGSESQRMTVQQVIQALTDQMKQARTHPPPERKSRKVG